MMPKLDGLQVVKKLRAHGCDTPVMILTAKSELEDKVEGLDSVSYTHLYFTAR